MFELPKMHSVSSSNVDAVGYDPDGERLYVRFHSGDIYEYHGVPKDVYEDLLAAPSVGRFLNYEIKGRYSYSRVG